MNMSKISASILVFVLILAGCSEREPVLTTPAIKFEVNDKLHTSLSGFRNGDLVRITDFQPSEYIMLSSGAIKDFDIINTEIKRINEKPGRGRSLTVTGNAEGIEKKLVVSVYDNYPSVAVTEVVYTNNTSEPVDVHNWVNNAYSLANTTPSAYDNSFWSYQSGSYSRRPDWVLPVNAGFAQENYMGQNQSDYGGGTPVTSIWRPDGGLAIGHLELVPKLVSLPVKMTDESKVDINVNYTKNVTLNPGESLETFKTFVRLQEADYFASLVDYRDLMIDLGISFPEVQPSAYETQWCAWGYEREFTMDQVYNTLPKVGDLGYYWVVLDDGWQNNVGDWDLNAEKYPAGDSDMATFVNTVNDAGYRSKLWWAPLAMHESSSIWETNPEYLLLNEQGEPEFITWWNAYYMCPAYEPVVEFHTDIVDRMFEVWGYEGIKIDGQHLNGASACYNPAHNHARPEESVEAMPTFFEAVYNRARHHVDDALIEICPCGTAYAFHLMPYMTQGVSSDPTSSWQVRHKGRTLKALMGRNTPFYGDHVELSRNGDDFASQIGIGAVIGTKFTWPVGAGPDPETDLTPERESYWKKWSDLYQSTRLAEGEYIGELYDIGFDRPEAHVIKKDDSLYYAFYSDQNPGRSQEDIDTYDGVIELRGLQPGKTYQVTDYENNVDYGQISGPAGSINVTFTNHILLQVRPQ